MFKIVEQQQRLPRVQIVFEAIKCRLTGGHAYAERLGDGGGNQRRRLHGRQIDKPTFDGQGSHELTGDL